MAIPQPAVILLAENQFKSAKNMSENITAGKQNTSMKNASKKHSSKIGENKCNS